MDKSLNMNLGMLVLCTQSFSIYAFVFHPMILISIYAPPKDINVIHSVFTPRNNMAWLGCDVHKNIFNLNFSLHQLKIIDILERQNNA